MSHPHPDRRAVLRALGAAGLVLRGSILGLLGCGGEKDTGAAGEKLYFAVITDPHVRTDPKHSNNLTLAQTLAILEGLPVPVAFAVLTGDLLDELPSDDPAYYEKHPESSLQLLVEILGGSALPVHAVLGNHDYYTDDGGLKNGVTEDKPAREALLCGKLGLPGPWYRFDRGGVAFYALNTMQQDPAATWAPDSCGSFGPEQLAWLEDQLADGVPAFLFFHHPLALDCADEAGAVQFLPFEVPRAEGAYEKYEGTEYEGWTDPIYELLRRHAGQILAAFVGHGHWFVRDVYEGIQVLEGDSIGNSLQRTEHEGEPMRYHVVECDLRAGTFAIWNEDWIVYDT